MGSPTPTCPSRASSTGSARRRPTSAASKPSSTSTAGSWASIRPATRSRSRLPASADDAVLGTGFGFAFFREGVGEGEGDQLGAGGVAGRGEVDAVFDEPVVFDVGGPVVDAHVGVGGAGGDQFLVPLLHVALRVGVARFD